MRLLVDQNLSHLLGAKVIAADRHLSDVFGVGSRNVSGPVFEDTGSGVRLRLVDCRITIDAAQMGGVPCIRRLRIPVATVIGMIAGGMTLAEVVDELPPLDLEDVRAALRFAADADADAVADREILLKPTA